MSDNSKLMDIAAKAEQDLNSNELKFGVQEGTGFGKKSTAGAASSSKQPSLLSPRQY